MEHLIGLIDDDIETANKHKILFELSDINSLVYKGDFTEKNILEWILQNQIECVLIDYKLLQTEIKLGSKLIHYINNMLPSFPCFLLTSFKGDAEGSNLINKDIIFEKNIIENVNENHPFIETLNKAIKVFKKRMEINEEKYDKLLSKFKSQNVLESEEAELKILDRILKSYGIIEEVSLEKRTKKI